MPKVGKKQAKRLQARIKDWEDLRADGMRTEKVKMIGKSGFTKPGSNRK